MASVNKVIVVGNLGRDLEMRRSFRSGDQVGNVTIATTDKWKDKQTGEMKEATEWHRVVFNGRLAEIVGQYLRKGSQVYVEGSLRTRKWTEQGRHRKIHHRNPRRPDADAGQPPGHGRSPAVTTAVAAATKPRRQSRSARAAAAPHRARPPRPPGGQRF